MSDADAPALPNGRSAPPAVAQAGCIVACGLALLLILYVGSFAFIVLDWTRQWGVLPPPDEQTEEALKVAYWPLIWLWNQA